LKLAVGNLNAGPAASPDAFLLGQPVFKTLDDITMRTARMSTARLLRSCNEVSYCLTRAQEPTGHS